MSLRKSHATRKGDVPDSYGVSAVLDPQGSGRVDMLTHPYTVAACAAGVECRRPPVGTARAVATTEAERARQLALDCEYD